MKKITLLDILDALHLSKHVNSPDAFRERGGLMLTGRPAVFKTTYISNVFSEHYDALIISDINIQTLKRLRDDIRSERYNTLAFTEYEKLYQRRQETASNLEGCIKALVGEGFDKFSFEDSRMSVGKARCAVVGAMTTRFYERKYDDWHDNGFLRRFLWCNIDLHNPQMIINSISAWKPIDFGDYTVKKVPGNKFIELDVTDSENERLLQFLKHQPGQEIPFILLKKILSVLKWKYSKQDPARPMAIIKDFSECLKDTEAAKIEL